MHNWIHQHFQLSEYFIMGSEQSVGEKGGEGTTFRFWLTPFLFIYYTAYSGYSKVPISHQNTKSDLLSIAIIFIGNQGW